MERFRRIWALLVKEVLAVWRDKKSRMTLIVPPIIQLFIFAWAATLDVKNVPIGILSKDNGEQAFELVQRFHGSPVFTKIIYLKSEKEIADNIDNQKVVMVLHIDEQFSRNLDAKKVLMCNLFWMVESRIRHKFFLGMHQQLSINSIKTMLQKRAFICSRRN